MKTTHPESAWASLFLATLLLALPALADDDAARGDARDGYREGYQRGYDDGFASGYRKAQEEARAAAAPAPRPGGPIVVSGATYGTSSHNCDATRYVARRANGRLSHSFEVTNEMCGDPAYGERKLLQVTYVCGSVAKSASANEHRTIYLDCNP